MPRTIRSGKPSGRPSNYEEKVATRFEDIRKMALTMTEKQIAKTLGVGYSTWCEYKIKYPELQENLKKGRESLVLELKSALIQKAKGFNYTEKKIIKENGVVVREEEYTKFALPDVAALNLLLKNYDEQWRNDPAEYELKKRAIEVQEKKLEQNEFGLLAQ